VGVYRGWAQEFRREQGETMTTLGNRPNTALLVVDVQNGVVEGHAGATRSSRTSAALSRRRGGNGFPSSGSSTPTSSLREGATTGGSSPS